MAGGAGVTLALLCTWWFSSSVRDGYRTDQKNKSMPAREEIFWPKEPSGTLNKKRLLPHKAVRRGQQ